MSRPIVTDAEDGYPTRVSATAADRSSIAKVAAHTRWSKTTDRTAATQPARDGLTKRFEDQVDPERRLSPDERAQRVESARRAHFQRLALKSAQARRAKRSA